jgi:hypothetical protein
MFGGTWLKMLLAILLGNLIYFVLLPHVPDELRHDVFRLDLGLFLDMGLCALIYLLIRRIA